MDILECYSLSMVKISSLHCVYMKYCIPKAAIRNEYGANGKNRAKSGECVDTTYLSLSSRVS